MPRKRETVVNDWDWQLREQAHAKKNVRWAHRCYEERLSGVIEYENDRARVRLDHSDLWDQLRSQFERRHGIELIQPEHDPHLTLCAGAFELGEQGQLNWGALEGETVDVWVTRELFWKGRFVWVNAYCERARLIRETLWGLDGADEETWGHVTVGLFPPGRELPRFLDYRDLEDWGFRP